MANPPKAPATVASDAPCPCGSGKTFGDCCEPILKGTRVATTAEEVMRSRFTAHYLRDHQHLHRTYLATARQPYAGENEAMDFNWTRLVIHAHEASAQPDVATVDFTAYYADGGRELALHEKSEFLKVGDTWLYARALRNGPAPIRSTGPKVGRNDPCPCGSGKKFKHCCGR